MVLGTITFYETPVMSQSCFPWSPCGGRGLIEGRDHVGSCSTPARPHKNVCLTKILRIDMSKYMYILLGPVSFVTNFNLDFGRRDV